MKILVLTTNFGRKKCGIRDYTYLLYKEPIDGVKFEIQPISFKNILTAPFAKNQIIHIQHGFLTFDDLLSVTAIPYTIYLWIFSWFYSYKIYTTIHAIHDLRNVEETFKHISKNVLLLKVVGIYLYIHYAIVIALSKKAILLSKKGMEILQSSLNIDFVNKKMVFLPLGIYPIKYNFNQPESLHEKFGVVSSDKILTCFGFAYKHKGYHLAVEAMNLLVNDQKVTDYKLFIISGEGLSINDQCRDYLIYLKELTAKYKLEKYVFFTGYLEDEDPILSTIFNYTKYFLFPYMSRESASASLGTILPYQKNIICSDIATFDEFDFAIKFKNEDPADLAQKILSQDDYTETSSKLDKYIQENSINNIFKRHVELFKQS